MIPSIEFYNANPNLKRVGQKIQFTKEQVEEFIRCRDDKIYFAENYMKIVHVDKGLMTIPLYKYQKQLLKKLSKNRFVICLQSRQSGKTTTLTIDMLHYILFNNYKTCAILANKGATAREILHRIKMAYEHLPKWLQQGVVSWNKGSIELENGSRILTAASSSDNIRGQAVSYLFVDETAFLEGWDEFYSSVYPTISSGKESRIVLVSTANGMNHYYKLWEDAVAGRSAYAHFEVKWDDVPGRDEAWKEETIGNTSREAFYQEHENQFLGSANTLILPSALREMVMKVPAFTSNDSFFTVYEEPKGGHSYVVTVDTSHGKGLDNSAFSVIDVTEYPFKQVARYYNADISPLLYPNVVFHVCKQYNEAWVLVETNDIGEQIVNTLNYELEYENILSNMNDKKKYSLGVRMTKSVKALGCATMRDLIESKKLLVHDKDTIFELGGFISKGKSYEADTGFNDDLAMTLVLFGWLTNQENFDELREGFNVRKLVYEQQMEHLEEDLMPFVIIEDGTDEGEVILEIEPDGTVWRSNVQ